ncbi:Peptidoglycan/LPS O-acetylase OafA/YrhL, contains acyltransferase and SGNH-hydrolase domains [Pseudobutyrivibrio sp. ACV-2]|uniref:acyltransferase family protein n=1 Tax=Pseudobutyrivibrio sp. ACV-2 TaxID=1520801 RepID=UPI0008948F24|nr:acyltransferase [Pseudobutyrivibrio sp. ACV-2]SEA01505.1 Peptidoglycan/LPS O-acetylase OafA/YrhL, contains acyltransferase and SGNH-hydrolase domains [Pseudobutyrivibrio sp. ACV-2]
MDTKRTVQDRIVSFQALRALAFLGIFLSHAGSDIRWPTLGVSIFYVLSGFLTFYKHGNDYMNSTVKDNIRFSWNHISKLYPLHIITMCFAVLLEIILKIQYGLTVKGLLVIFGKIILSILLIQTWVPYSSINVSLNGVSWYLSVSLFLYFMFPVIKNIIIKKKNSFLFITCLFILLLEIILCIPWVYILGEDSKIYIWFMYCFPVFRMGDFIVGICLGKWYKEGVFDHDLNFFKMSVVEIFATIITILAYRWKNVRGGVLIESTHNRTTIYIVIAAVWVVLFAKANGVITKSLCNKMTYFLGDISPYIFLIHYVVTSWTNVFVSCSGLQLGFVIKYIVIVLELIISVLLACGYKRIKTHCI